jgi:hypothetical protein
MSVVNAFSDELSWYISFQPRCLMYSVLVTAHLSDTINTDGQHSMVFYRHLVDERPHE